MLKKTPKTLKA